MNKNNVAIDYLRAFVIALVLAHHSFIAYSNIPAYAIKTFAAPSGIAPSAIRAFTSKPYIWSSFPIVDSQHWAGFDLLILFNDIFFMSLMFFLAGLFVGPSILRKGHHGYLRGRMLRLGLPFAVAAFLSPLAYYPSYLTTGADPAAGAFLRQWFSLDFWPPGPPWFVAVLLGFSFLAFLVHKFLPSWIETLGKLCSGAAQRPARFFFGLIGISGVAYLTMCSAFGPTNWFVFGPFVIQSCRVLLYPTYFFAGVGIGVWGIGRGLLARDGRLARRWPMWLCTATCVFALYALKAIQQINALGPSPSFALQRIGDVFFVLNCGAISFFLLAVFVRFANRRIGMIDSLSANAYGIYLVHYVFVTWIQYELLDVNLPAIQKGVTVFVVTLLLSWGTVASIRLLPFIDRILTSGARPNSGGQV